MRAEGPARRGSARSRKRCHESRCPGSGRRPARVAGMVADNWLVTFNDQQLTARGRRGHRPQRRPARRRHTCRAGAALRQAGGREALSVGRPARARRRQDVRRRLGAARAACSPWPGNSISGDASGTAGPRRRPTRRRPSRTSSTRGSRSPRSSPAAGSWPSKPACRRSWRGRPSDAEKSSCGWPKPDRASASATTRTSRSRAPTSGPIATRSGRSNWRVSRRSGRWRSCSAAIRRRRSSSPRACRRSRTAFREGCRRSSSSAVPTSSPPSGASPPPSIASARRRRRGCRRLP